MSKLEAANNPAAGDDEEDEEAKQEASKYKICMRLVLPSAHDFCFLFVSTEKKAFRARMKGHYKGEFNAAALLR